MSRPSENTETGRPEPKEETRTEVLGEPSDGGFTAWLQVAGSFFIFFNTWGVVNMYGVYQAYYQSALLSSESESNISWIGSVQGFLLFLFSMVAGPLHDAGYLRSLLLVGTCLVVLGMMITSICTVYWQFFLAQGVAIGIGDGLLFLPSMVIISQYFSAKKAFAIGIASIGSSIGAIIYPIIFRQLEPSIGFVWTTRVIAFIMLGTSMISLIGMKQRLSHTTLTQVLDLEAFRDLTYVLFCFGVFFGFMGVYIPFFYIELYAIQKCNTGPELTSYLLVIVNSGSLFGRLIPNYLADKTGPLNMHIVFAFCTALLAYCWIAISSTTNLVVFCVLYGFFSGTFVSLPGPILISLSSDLSSVGTRLGMSMAFAGIGLLIGNPVAGVILRQQHSWVDLQIWAGAVITVSALFMLTARISKVGPGLMAKS